MTFYFSGGGGSGGPSGGGSGSGGSAVCPYIHASLTLTLGGSGQQTTIPSSTSLPTLSSLNAQERKRRIDSEAEARTGGFIGIGSGHHKRSLSKVDLMVGMGGTSVGTIPPGANVGAELVTVLKELKAERDALKAEREALKLERETLRKEREELARERHNLRESKQG